jgi:hypothetical protein
MAASTENRFGALVDEYRSLVESPASEEHLERALDLAEEVFGYRLRAASLDQKLTELEEEERLEGQLYSRLSDDLRDFSRDSLQDSQLKRRRKKELILLQSRVHRTAVALSIPRFLDETPRQIPGGDYSLLVDVLLVVFHQAYFWLLPTLPASMSDELGLLLRSFWLFADSVPSRAERCRLRAMVFEATGQSEKAVSMHLEAVRLTSPEADEFLTVLQSAWSALVDLGRFSAAASLLFEFADKVPSRDVEEMRELLEMTLDAKLKRAAPPSAA